MRRLVIFTILISAAVAASAGTKLDLNATAEEYVGEGIIYHRLLFKDDQRTMSLELPPKWAYRGSANRLQLTPPGEKMYAEGTVEVAPLAAPQALDAVTMQAFTEHAIAQVPPGAQAVKLVGTVDSALFIEGNPGFEVTVSYKTLGETFRRNMTFVNFPDKQLVFRFTARDGDFDSLYKTFRRAVTSWQPIKAEAPSSAAAQVAQTN